MHAFEADAVRPGVNGIVINAGKIISIDHDRQQQRWR